MPTIHRKRGYRFYFNSNEGTEPVHIHIKGEKGRMKVWLKDLIIANVLTRTNDFAESSNSISQTKEIKSKIFFENNTKYQIIDTVGIGDTKLSQEEVLDKIAKAVYLSRAGIHQRARSEHKTDHLIQRLYQPQ